MPSKKTVAAAVIAAFGAAAATYLAVKKAGERARREGAGATPLASTTRMARTADEFTCHDADGFGSQIDDPGTGPVPQLNVEFHAAARMPHRECEPLKLQPARPMDRFRGFDHQAGEQPGIGSLQCPQPAHPWCRRYWPAVEPELQERGLQCGVADFCARYVK